jgi:hypothetical protein
VSALARDRPSAPALRDHHPLGISTGVFADGGADWAQLVVRACRVSTYAVELSALSEPELPALSAFLAGRPRLPFRYLAVHAPVKDRVTAEVELVARLSEIPWSVRSLVTHPDALGEPERYRSLGSRLVLENMDARKPDGRTAQELAPYFEALPQAGFCLDVAHVSSLDPSLGLAHELLDRHGRRLRQVHLSSLLGGEHAPLGAGDEARFAGVLARCRDVPWILEARPPERWWSGLKASCFVESAM